MKQEREKSKGGRENALLQFAMLTDPKWTDVGASVYIGARRP